MLEKHVSSHQMEKAQQRHQSLGDERSQSARQHWAKIVNELQALQRQGQAANAKAPQTLGAQGKALLNEFTNNDTSIQDSLLASGPVFFSHLGLDISQELSDYVVKAVRSSYSGQD